MWASNLEACLRLSRGGEETTAEMNFIHVIASDIAPEEKGHHSWALNSLLNILHPDP